MREGSALLQGLVTCGHCGRRLHVHYRGRNSAPGYHCAGKDLVNGRVYCLNLGGTVIEQAVADAFLQAITPAAIEATRPFRRTTASQSRRGFVAMAEEMQRLVDGRIRALPEPQQPTTFVALLPDAPMALTLLSSELKAPTAIPMRPGMRTSGNWDRLASSCFTKVLHFHDTSNNSIG